MPGRPVWNSGLGVARAEAQATVKAPPSGKHDTGRQNRSLGFSPGDNAVVNPEGRAGLE